MENFNKTLSNMKDLVGNNNSKLITTVILTIVLFFIITFIHYTITYTKIKGDILLKDNHDGKKKKVVKINGSETNTDFTYSFWFYIESFDYRKTHSKVCCI